MRTRRLRNRLYDAHVGSKCVSFKADRLLDKAVKTLIENGYANISEVIYDAVYSKMNEINGDDTYPTLESFKKRKSAEEHEMEMALLSLSTLKDRLGGMRVNQ